MNLNEFTFYHNLDSIKIKSSIPISFQTVKEGFGGTAEGFRGSRCINSFRVFIDLQVDHSSFDYEPGRNLVSHILQKGIKEMGLKSFKQVSISMDVSCSSCNMQGRIRGLMRGVPYCLHIDIPCDKGRGKTAGANRILILT